MSAEDIEHSAVLGACTFIVKANSYFIKRLLIKKKLLLAEIDTVFIIHIVKLHKNIGRKTRYEVMMHSQAMYCVGDIFRVFDRGLQKEKLVVLARFIIEKEHFTLLSLSTFERWTDRELAYVNQFEKTRLSREEILYLSGEDSLTYVGNINMIAADLAAFINEKFTMTKSV
jgi:hypothetical protein